MSEQYIPRSLRQTRSTSGLKSTLWALCLMTRMISVLHCLDTYRYVTRWLLIWDKMKIHVIFTSIGFYIHFKLLTWTIRELSVKNVNAVNRKYIYFENLIILYKQQKEIKSKWFHSITDISIKYNNLFSYACQKHCHACRLRRITNMQQIFSKNKIFGQLWF